MRTAFHGARGIAWLVCGLILAVNVPFAAGQAVDGGGHIKTTEPLSGIEQQRRFRLPPGFEIQLVAAEPDIHKPINLTFDSAGRLLATGSIEYPYAQPDPALRRDQVTRFTIGTDGRGIDRQVVLDGLNIPIGLATLPQPRGPDDLLVFSIPELLRCRDMDGDGRYETREPLLTGFGFRDTHGLVNGLTPWIDGWIYACHGFSNESVVVARDGSTITIQSGNTFRFRPDGTQLEALTRGQVNPFGLCFDPLGRIFTADCHTLPAYNLIRGAWYPSFGKPHDGLGFGPSIMRHQHGSTGISGIAIYADERFPSEYRGTIFIGNPITARINHDRLESRGGSVEAVELPDFLVCDDPWFRPVDIQLGPDGALYVADFYTRIIGHYEVPLDHPQRERERGRIWRIVYRGEKGLPPGPIDLSRASAEQLVKRMSDSNLAIRALATRRWAVHPDRQATIERLAAQVVDPGRQPEARAHALAALALGAPGRLDATLWGRVLDDGPPLLVAHAIHTLAEGDDPAWRAELIRVAPAFLASDAGIVRRAIAEGLGRPLAGGIALAPLLAAWRSTPETDTHTIHALRIALREQLRGQPGLEEARRLLSGPEADRIAEIALGLSSTEGAHLIREYLTKLKSFPTLVERLVEHEVRWIEAAQFETVMDELRRFQQLPVAEQAGVLRAGSRGAQARQRALPASWQHWRDRLLEQLLVGMEPAELRAGIELARELRPASAFVALERLAGHAELSVEVRSAALEAATACNPGQGVALLGGLFEREDEPIPLRSRAIQLLGTLQRDEARGRLVEALKVAPEKWQQELALALSGTTPGCERLVELIEQGKASSRLLLDGNLLRRLERAPLERGGERLAKLKGSLAPEDAALPKLIATRRAGWASARVDLEKGQAVFKKTCAACHKLAGEGTKIGPELDGIGQRGLERVLEDLLDPSRNVDQAFRSTVIQTTDGRALSGLLLRSEGETLVLADGQGKELRVARGEIEEQVVMPFSPMPANLGTILPEEDFFHLVGFLLAQRKALTPSAEPSPQR